MMDDRLKAALNMAHEAGELAKTMRESPSALETSSKGRMDLVTAADHAVEALLRERILKFEPDVAILGEEGGMEGTGKAVWILDPIDGTMNFSRGLPDWAISIAFFDGTQITHGVIHAPDLGITAWAKRGHGSFLNGRQIVFGDTVPESPIVALGYSPRGALTDYFARIETLLDAGIEHRRHGAATIGFLGVLAGWFDAFFEPALNIWDVAAGLLIVEEAGGVVRHDPFSDFLERPSNVLARNRGFPGLTTIVDSAEFA
ncbi:inositol monophosphatase family protein [Yoonia sediminilitoris]|uniref:Inositol-1-monophosphatase n=1 Tax=Yoonia sediminilitoris TaxID=1286148 RepID=A0A2T6KHA0_9RHOB|nr:inositol monophosphatase [Yoonia sediminilitoris]PUB14878.1 myo-inositol-1(or 4)-monophosphatase [Yoonia sediminilitoris]RCW95595.1 myo-inositol-1(or 4)-monophosphatase [Yoonia sediminilitoris]